MTRKACDATHKKKVFAKAASWSSAILFTVMTPASAQAPRGLTALAGVKVGHHTLSARPTGCTVVLLEGGAVAGVDVRGAAPGTRDTDLLDPVNTVQEIHALVFAGGSAFGLATADGVMRYLAERRIGYPMGGVHVPIVPAAILFDLGVGDASVRPGADCGYDAAASASNATVPEGNVGAGAGATVGKLGGRDRAMKGGIGTASITLPNGVIVAAMVAVNAVGDIIDPATAEVVAGVRTSDGTSLADARKLIRDGSLLPRSDDGANTTLGIVGTNVALTKSQATKIAQMSHDGFARAISPAHTTADGDTIFAFATGTHSATVSVTILGALAAEVTADAILRAVRAAQGIPGYPSASDLTGR